MQYANDIDDLLEQLQEPNNCNVLDYIDDAVEAIKGLRCRSQALVKENNKLSKDINKACEMIGVWVQRAETAERERDAAVEQLHGYCPACAHYTANYCDGACAECKHEYYQYRSPEAQDKWEWNGGDKEE